MQSNLQWHMQCKETNTHWQLKVRMYVAEPGSGHFMAFVDGQWLQEGTAGLGDGDTNNNAAMFVLQKGCC
jgi:hypothetical protein